MPRPVHLASAKKRVRPNAKSVSVYDAETLKWHSAGKTGLSLKPVREDRDKGRFLGLVGFEPLTRSGLHQHLGVATSFVLDGSLTDYQGPIVLHQTGINLKGATHDAIAYQKTLLVSRLEAPVIYPEATDRDYALHTGPRFGSIRNPDPEAEPDVGPDSRIEDLAVHHDRTPRTLGARRRPAHRGQGGVGQLLRGDRAGHHCFDRKRFRRRLPCMVRRPGEVGRGPGAGPVRVLASRAPCPPN